MPDGRAEACVNAPSTSGWTCPVCFFYCQRDWLVCPVCDYVRAPDMPMDDETPSVIALASEYRRL